jgi:hypothetical protein
MIVRYIFVTLFLLLALVLSCEIGLGLQSELTNVSESKPFSLDGIYLGMPRKDVRKALGKPRNEEKGEDFFALSDKHWIQVIYEKDRAATVSSSYLGTNAETPAPEKIFNEQIKPSDDGSIFKQVTFNDKGYWISYSKSAGKSPFTTITVKRLRQPENSSNARKLE